MPYTPENQKTYPQPEGQEEGVGFLIACLIAIISLSCGAVLDIAIGPYKGKETGEYALLRLLFSGNVGLSYATTTAIMEHCRYEKSFTPIICVHLC